MVYKAVGFDMDGTFLETKVDYDRLNNADRRVMESHGIPFEQVDFGGRQKRLRSPIREWLDANGRSDEWDAIYKEIDEETLRCECEFVSEARPIPGAIDCLRSIKAMGLKVGILTRGGIGYARLALGELFSEFDFVMGRDYSFYDDAKPSPVAMVQFCKELGVEPDEMLYIGDNITDWQSAVGAGADFVGVLTGSETREGWRATDPNIRVVSSVADVSEIVRRSQ